MMQRLLRQTFRVHHIQPKRWLSSSTLTIGEVSLPVSTPAKPHLVPRGYDREHGSAASQLQLEHLRWMMQKDILKQDMFLIGAPGPDRRRLALRYAQLTQREVEFVAVTRDTTESDLKQRREIVHGDAKYVDQAPVRAAVHGRLLVLDGIEKAERNVLPTLNNLLENREMQLDDGRFLMSAERYDELVQQGATEEQLAEKKLIRAHPDFRVVALGTPVPPYRGKPLDPPLRSRFQARYVAPPPTAEKWVDLMSVCPADAPQDRLKKLASIGEAMQSFEALSYKDSSAGVGSGGKMPHFPDSALECVAQILYHFPQESERSLLARQYPYFGLSPPVGFPFLKDQYRHREIAKVALHQYGLVDPDNFDSPLCYNSCAYRLDSISRDPSNPTIGNFRFMSRNAQGDPITVHGPIGGLPLVDERHEPFSNGRPFYKTETHSDLIAALTQDHCFGRDMLLVGGAGSGKSELIRSWASEMGYSVDLFSLYKDMTARDLLQRRATDNLGNTSWEHSPLIDAAIHGRMVVLDGVDRLDPETLTVIQRLMTDREVDLYDGSRLVRAIDCDVGKDTSNVHVVDPRFRVVALAGPPTDTNRWYSEEVMSMFSTHVLPPLTPDEQIAMIRECYPLAPLAAVEAVVHFATCLEEPSNKKTTGGQPSTTVAASLGLRPLSTRQLIRMAKKMHAYPEKAHDNLGSNLLNVLMAQFLPAQQRESLDKLMTDCGIDPASAYATSNTQIDASEVEMEVRSDAVRIGDVMVAEISPPQHPELVPAPKFFNIPKHQLVLREMLRDVSMQEHHILLIGNQGVGKNKLADRLLELLQCEREYVQLHRDSTVGSLTLAPNLKDGVIVWEDSPLVRAVIHGRTIIVDEADKAPLEVISVLKSLVEDEEMLLADGRRILSPARCEREMQDHHNRDVVPIHPNFRMWVLANRPGFPFLGNNLFQSLGDIFSVHVISNPDRESEIKLLQAYGPSVDDELLTCLTNAFAELRNMVDEGILSYPYSTREAVAIVKHVEQFPEDGIVQTLENVLAFDSFDAQLRQTIAQIFQKHGIPLAAESAHSPVSGMLINIARPAPLPDAIPTETWS